MKDMIGREVEVGNYIAYGLVVGRSANLAIYKVKEVSEYQIKAVKLESSYGRRDHTVVDKNGKEILYRYANFVYNPDRNSYYEEMSQEQKDKVDNKTSTLKMPERIFILDNFDKSLFE